MSYIGNQPFTAAFLTDTFSGTGSQTAFTMTVAPANTSSILVSITGVLQDPSTYSVSGTTLTFSAAPPSGTSNISVRYLGIPASGVTTTAYRTVTDTTATAGQTSFTIPSYTVGYVDVLRNGVRLPASDYTATTGTTVVLNNAATAGDTITTISFYVSSVLNAIPATAGSVGSTYLASNLALTSPSITGGTWTSPSGSTITSGTAVASTSGTSIDFTGIPSWVKRITVMLNGVSTTGTSPYTVRLGVSGTPETTGYTAICVSYQSATVASGQSTAGFVFTIAPNMSSASTLNGPITFSLLGSNTWVCSGALSREAGSDTSFFTMGSKTLAGTLNMVRITTNGGTDTFDAGSINILYE